MSLRLLQLREENNLSQDDLAQILNVTRQAYSRYERGERQLGYKALQILSNYFDCSIDYILGFSEFYFPDRIKTIITNNESYSPEEKELIERYRNLSPDLQDMLIGILKTWEGEQSKPKKKV